MTSVEVATGTEGQVVVVKRAPAGPDAERLAHEAEVLDAVRGPGTAELLGFEADDRGAELRTAWAGHHTLATLGPLPTVAAARLLADLADTVARVHELRIAHNRLTAEHIVLGAAERPVLCGFGRASRGDTLAMDADVVALGELLTSLLGPDDPVTFGPDRRSRRQRPAPERAALLTLADRAAAHTLGGRPSAATFAEAVRELILVAPVHRPPRRSLPRWSLPRWAPVVAGVVGAALVLGAVALATGDDPPARPRAAEPDPTSPIGVVDQASDPLDTPATPSAAPVPTPLPTVPELPPPTCPPTSPPAADVDGDGCPEPYTVDGALVTLAGRTYEVGRSGDLAAIADWDCDGRATPAVVRPATGEVFVFTAWAEPTAEVTVSPITVVGGATGVRAGDDVLCPDLLVTRGDGTEVAVAAEP